MRIELFEPAPPVLAEKPVLSWEGAMVAGGTWPDGTEEAIGASVDVDGGLEGSWVEAVGTVAVI